MSTKSGVAAGVKSGVIPAGPVMTGAKGGKYRINPKTGKKDYHVPGHLKPGSMVYADFGDGVGRGWVHSVQPSKQTALIRMANGKGTGYAQAHFDAISPTAPKVVTAPTPPKPPPPPAPAHSGPAPASAPGPVTHITNSAGHKVPVVWSANNGSVVVESPGLGSHHVMVHKGGGDYLPIASHPSMSAAINHASTLHPGQAVGHVAAPPPPHHSSTPHPQLGGGSQVDVHTSFNLPAVKSTWASSDGATAVVKTSHNPPKFAVMEKGGLGTWQAQSYHPTAEAAVSHVAVGKGALPPAPPPHVPTPPAPVVAHVPPPPENSGVLAKKAKLSMKDTYSVGEHVQVEVAEGVWAGAVVRQTLKGFAKVEMKDGSWLHAYPETTKKKEATPSPPSLAAGWTPQKGSMHDSSEKPSHEGVTFGAKYHHNPLTHEANGSLAGDRAAGAEKASNAREHDYNKLGFPTWKETHDTSGAHASFSSVEQPLKTLPHEQVSAIKAFTGSKYPQIRAADRGWPTYREYNDGPELPVTEEHRKQARHCREAIEAAAVPIPGVLHRGLKNLSLNQVHEILGKEQVRLGGFSSTSRTSRVADGFAQGDPNKYSIRFEMSGMKGLPVERISSLGRSESEVLVHGHQNFRVGGVTKIVGGPGKGFKEKFIVKLEAL